MALHAWLLQRLWQVSYRVMVQVASGTILTFVTPIVSFCTWSVTWSSRGCMEVGKSSTGWCTCSATWSLRGGMQVQFEGGLRVGKSGTGWCTWSVTWKLT